MTSCRAPSGRLDVWRHGRLCRRHLACATSGRKPMESGDLYVRMADRGELRTYPGRVTDVGAFLRDVAAEVGPVRRAGADRHRVAEGLQALEGCSRALADDVARHRRPFAKADGSRTTCGRFSGR